MDLLRKALREVEARVKPFTAASTSRSDPNDLAGTRLVVAGRTFRVGAMFAEGGAARVYRCASVSDGPGKRDDGRDGTVDAAEASAPLALKQCLLPPELSDAEARREGVVHASVSAHDDVVTLHAHDVLVPPETRGEEKRNARGESARGRARAALLVMDLCEESLAERARRLGGLGEADALRACACAARAVAHMHACDPPVAHFDVKPENVLSAPSSPPVSLKKKKNENAAYAASDFTKSSTWRLCDFGSAHVGGDRVFSTPRDRSRAESQFARTTTPTYRAPEMWDVRHPVFAARGVGRPADVWALGCLLFQLLEDRPPFGADAKLAALSGRFAWSPEVCSRTSEKTRALVKHALATDPSSRPSAAEVAARCEALAADAEAGPVRPREVEEDEAPLGNVPEPPDVPEPSEPETGWASFEPSEPSARKTSAAAFGKPADEDARAEENAAETESSLGETTTGWATFS